MDQVLFGAYNLSQSRVFVNDGDGERTTNGEIQKLANGNYSGSTIVNKRIGEKPINLTGVISADNNYSLVNAILEFDTYTNKENRYLRFARTWLPVFSVDSVDNLLVGSDAINKTFDQTSYMFGSGSCSYDADVSVSADNKVTVQHTSNSTINIVPYGNTGCFEFWMYIPDKTYISSFDLYVGSDTSNYLKYLSLTTQYDGTAIENGWNYFSVAIADMSAIGVPDYYRIGKYFYISTNYLSAQADLTGFKFGGLIWQLDSDTRNYKGYFETIAKEVGHSNISHTIFKAMFICASGLGESTDDVNIMSLTGQTAHPFTYTINMTGTYNPDPVITLGLTSQSGMDKIGLSNLTTGDTVEIDETWANGDQIVFDIPNKQILRNNTSINYTNVLPRFVLGNNTIYIYFTSATETIISYTVATSNLAGF